MLPRQMFSPCGDRRRHLNWRSSYGAVSLVGAVRELVPNAEVSVVAGTGVLLSEPTHLPAAVAAAREAEAVIVYVGGKGGWFGSGLTEGERRDTANIDLPAQQVELIHALPRSASRSSPSSRWDVPKASHPSSSGCRPSSRPTSAAVPGCRGRRRPLRCHQPWREAAVHGSAARRAGADLPQPKDGQRVPTHRRRHPQGLPRHAGHPSCFHSATASATRPSDMVCSGWTSTPST